MFEFQYQDITVFYLFILVLAIYIGWRLNKLYKNIVFFFVKKKASNAEIKSINFLVKKGYEIIKIQPILKGSLYENREKKFFSVRPDLIVRKNGIDMIAEIKSSKSGNIENIDTRRQLLEYSFLSNTKIILIDFKNKKIKEIEFVSKD